MTTALAVLPEAYRTASQRVGVTVSTLVRLAAGQLVDALDGTGGMAGSDDCGREWGNSYDRAASAAFATMTDTYNALQLVGDLLDQTAANYASAESASAGGVIVGRDFQGEQARTLGAAPSSMGQGGVDLPGGWGMVEAFVHRAWPNGHQDLLHRAGNAWTRTCDELLDLVTAMGDALIALHEQRAPEVADAVIVVESLRDQLIDLGNACAAIGTACHAYAHHLDEAHHRIIQALEDLARDTAETVAVGTLFAIVTAGAGAIAAGAAEANIIRGAAEAIAAVIDTLMAFAVSLAAEADYAATRIAEVADAVRPVLARQVYESELVQSRIRNDSLVIGRVLTPVTEGAYSVGSTTIPAKALAEMEARAAAAAEAAVKRANLEFIDDPQLFDPLKLKGMEPAELRAAIPKGWKSRPASGGDGVVYEDPLHRGRQIRIMKGYPAGSRPDPITTGPYVVTSQNGEPVKIALAGNPTLT